MGARDARLELPFAAVAVAVAVAGVVDRAREVRDGFFCRDDVGGFGLDIDEMEGFLRSCPVDEAGRSRWDWLSGAGASTGSREVGLGIPEVRTGMEDGGSIRGTQGHWSGWGGAKRSGRLLGCGCTEDTVGRLRITG